MRRLVLTIFFLFAFLCSQSILPFESKSADSDIDGRATGRPNILFAIADDWSYGHASIYGCSWVQTPNFDRIAREGLLFTNAFTPNAKCAPSRATILTGRYSWELEEAGNHMAIFPPKFGGFMERLAADGYVTGHTGKGWGPGIAKDSEGNVRAITGKKYGKHKTKPPATKISSNDYAANFEDFFDDVADQKPWVFWYGTTEPHRAYEFRSGVRLGKKLSDIDRVPAYWPDTETVRHDMLDYAIEVEHYDKHLGKILAALENSGQLDNTLIVATSDHGMPFPRVKGQAYLHSNHIPMAIRWPHGITGSSRVIEDFVNFTDLAPTFLEAAGIASEAPIMQPTSGKSLFDIFRSETSGLVNPDRNYCLVGKERHDIGRPGDVGFPIRGIIQGDWLYLRNFESDRWPAGDPETGYLNCDGSPTKSLILNKRRSGEDRTHWEMCFGKRSDEEFYHLKTDSDCVINLAGSVEYADEIKAMESRMVLALKQQGDPRMLGNGEVFDNYPSTAGINENFYKRYLAGEKVNAGWVNSSDFEKQPLDKNGNEIDRVIVLYGDPNPSLGSPKPGELNHPFAVGFDPSGRIVIAEYTGRRVLRAETDGKLSVIAGHGEKGYDGDGKPAVKAAFNDLHNLAISRTGDIYLSDHENHAVRKISSKTGMISSFAGNGKPGFKGDGGPVSEASFHQIMCVTLTPDNKKLIVTDLKNRRIRSIDLDTNVVTTIAGNGRNGVPKNGAIATESPLVDPRAAAYDLKGNLYIVERSGNALRVVRPSGKIETVAGTGAKGMADGPALSARMSGPKHLALDDQGNVFIADDKNHLVRKYDPAKKTLTTVLGDGKWKLNRPHGVTVYKGHLYIADSWNHRVLKMPLK